MNTVYCIWRVTVRAIQNFIFIYQVVCIFMYACMFVCLFVRVCLCVCIYLFNLRLIDFTATHDCQTKLMMFMKMATPTTPSAAPADEDVDDPVMPAVNKFCILHFAFHICILVCFKLKFFYFLYLYSKFLNVFLISNQFYCNIVFEVSLTNIKKNRNMMCRCYKWYKKNKDCNN